MDPQTRTPLANIVEQFSHFCRTGKSHPSFIHSEKVGLYFNRMKNRVHRCLQHAFPLTHHILQKKQWNLLVKDFLSKEEFPSPFLWKMPETFVSYIQKNKWGDQFHIPYLEDLVHFEWVEIEMFMMPDAPRKTFSRKGDILEDLVYLNPESRLLSYSYPVFEKKKLPRPMDKGLYCVFAFRHPENKQIHFITLSPFFQTALDLLQKKPLTGRQALCLAAKAFKVDETQAVSSGEKFLNELHKQQALYGFLQKP